MAQFCLPKRLESKDLVISRPIMPLPGDFEYPQNQRGRARSLREIFEHPPAEMLMAVIRGDYDFTDFMGWMQRSADTAFNPSDLRASIIAASGIKNPDQNLLFPSPSLRIVDGGFGLLSLGGAEGNLSLGELALPDDILVRLSKSFLPKNGNPFIRFKGAILEGVISTQVPAVCLGPVACRFVDVAA